MSLPAWQENHPSSVQQNGLGPVLLEGMKQVKGIWQGISHRGFQVHWILPQDAFCFTQRPLPTISLAFPRNQCPQSFRFCSGHGLPISMQVVFPCCCPSMQGRTGESVWKHCSATEPGAALSAFVFCRCSLLGWPTQCRQCLWSYRDALPQERLCSHWDYDSMGTHTIVLIICVSHSWCICLWFLGWQSDWQLSVSLYYASG